MAKLCHSKGSRAIPVCTHLLPLSEAGQAGSALRLPCLPLGCRRRLTLGCLPGVCGRQVLAHSAAILLRPLAAQAGLQLRRQRVGALRCGGGGTGGGRRAVCPLGAGRHQHAGRVWLAEGPAGARAGRTFGLSRRLTAPALPVQATRPNLPRSVQRGALGCSPRQSGALSTMHNRRLIGWGWQPARSHLAPPNSPLQPQAMQLAVCGPTLLHCRPAARLPASGSALRCRTRRRLIARASSDGEQGPPPPPPAEQPGSEQQPLEGQADKSLQLPPDVIQQLRTTVFRWGGGAGGWLAAPDVCALPGSSCSPGLISLSSPCPSLQLRHILCDLRGKLPSRCVGLAADALASGSAHRPTLPPKHALLHSTGCPLSLCARALPPSYLTPDGVLFKGNLRGDPAEAYAKLTQRLKVGLLACCTAPRCAAVLA